MVEIMTEREINKCSCGLDSLFSPFAYLFFSNRQQNKETMRTRPRAEPTRMVTSKPAEHEANQAERLSDDQCVTLFSMFSCAAVCVQVSGSFIILKQKYIIVNQNNMHIYYYY